MVHQLQMIMASRFGVQQLATFPLALVRVALWLHTLINVWTLVTRKNNVIAQGETYVRRRGDLSMNTGYGRGGQWTDGS